MTDPLIGTTVGHYDITAKLGGGGMGVVYKARDRRLERQVALKFLPAQWSHDEDAQKRFMREAQAASATDHPSICTIHGLDQAPDGQLFIVMAYYEGVTLKQRLENGPLAVEEALEIATQLAHGLARAHRAGIVHRDIKPSNLILTDDAVKIVDFGLAKFADSMHLTVDAAPLGTYAYMSPEQVRAEEATAQADVWASGAVLYEMLTGRPPFHGSYFEAIAHAIRHESPAPIRASRPEVPEAVERVAFRAMHKDVAVRYANGKELALALLQARGLSAPVDLRSGAVHVPQLVAAPARSAAKTRRWPVVAVAAALVLVVAGIAMWRSTRPMAPREMISVVPVVNQTGYQELAPYRLALTYALIQELAESPRVRPLDYGRVAQFVEPAIVSGSDVSNRDVQRAMADQGRARWLVVPTLLHENGAWRARADVQEASTGSTVGRLETEAIASSLTKDAAYSRIIALADLIEQHFALQGGAARPSARPLSARLRTLDAVQALESGLAAMERLEYAAAREAFARAATLDGRHPLPQAWLSRVEQVLRRPDAAGEAADRAARLVTDDTPVSDALVARAVWATARQDFPEAESLYKELATRFPDEPRWQGELASFYERQGRLDDAVAIYQRVRGTPLAVPRFDLDLCRLYARRDDLSRAREHAALAIAQYREMGFKSGEAQARLCEADVLRLGGAGDRGQALGASFDALGVFDALGEKFNEARAHHYVAVALGGEGREAEAVNSWTRALAGAQATGNRALEGAVLNNLGVASEALGRRRQSLAYYEQSVALNEALGDEREAARAQVNAAAVLVEFGPSPDDGVRRVQSALTVFRKIGDKSFEVLGLRVQGAYHRNAGRTREAEQFFDQALAIARERGFEDSAQGVRLDLARTQLGQGRYAEAAASLEGLAREPRSRDSTHAEVLAGVARARLGDTMAAESWFDQAAKDVDTSGDASLTPLLLLSRGELALEQGDQVRALALFRQAAARADELPDASTVAAAAYRDWLSAGTGKRSPQALRDAVTRAAALKRSSLEGLCRMLQARMQLEAGDAEGASATLALDPAVESGLDPETAAGVQAVRAELFARLGETARSEAARAEVRRLVATIEQGLPEAARGRFAQRPGIAELVRASGR
jgi:serine/threonine protein kinase/tetratricopeptide (TPR) repeat protein